MESENKNEERKLSKMKRNKICVLLIGFYAGICVISDLAVKYYFKDKKKVETTILTTILILIKIPYLIKPLYGLLLDFFPICGYKKKSYLFMCFCVNITSWCIFIIFNEAHIIISIICLLFVHISLSFTTVIGSAIRVDLSKMYENDKSNIGEKSSQLVSQYFIIKSLGTLIPSYFKIFLIEKYTNDIIFYISFLISMFILISGIILEEEKIVENKKDNVTNSTNLLDKEKIKETNETNTQQIINLLKDKNIILLLSLIFILESSPLCISPLFYYETNILGLNPKNLSYIDFFSQISIIVIIYIYQNLCFKFNFKTITFYSRIFIFSLFSLIYMLIIGLTQKYINNLYLVTFAMAIREGFISLGKLPYNLLVMQYSPLNLEATTTSLSIFSSYLGNIFGDYIDYLLAIYFKITHYNFNNLSTLVLIEGIFNLIPLIITFAIPTKFFSKNKEKEKETSEQELINIEEKNDDNNKQ